MSRRLARWRGEVEADLPKVVVCRGGDCGSRRKHPRFDHAGQLALLRDRLGGGEASVLASRCLDACEHSNVVVVVPGRVGRDQGAEPTWFGEVLDEATTGAVIDLVETAAQSAEVEARRFEPSLQSRSALSAMRPARRTRGR